ncbi:hypothetical protein FACS1894132_04230 [Clostridia bacterium]|nr:hypothetical protein FACS1894132_04230 [Clostridia bacterium]
MQKNDYQKLYDFLTEYSELFEEVKVREEEKFKALHSRDPKRMDAAFNAHMDSEEKIKDFESKRTALHKELGLGEKTLKEVIETLDGEDKTNLTNLYEKLLNSINLTKEFNNRSLEFAQMNIDIVNEITGIFTKSTSYNASGTQTNQTTRPSILNKKA